MVEKRASSNLPLLIALSRLTAAQRNLLPSELATREELLERVHANMRPPPRA